MAKNNYSTLIRMGAAHHDVSIATSSSEVMHFDLRKMTRDEKRQFHGAFMEAFRKTRRHRRNAQDQLRWADKRSS